MSGLVAFISGIIFALGLGVSGMTQPHIVRGFLDILGNWNWSLLGVMGGAIAVHFIAFRLISRRESPLLGSQFHLPLQQNIDPRLIWGALLFGLGWGWAGICPGPGLVALVSGQTEFLYFIGAMLVGMKVFQLFDRKLSKRG